MIQIKFSNGGVSKWDEQKPVKISLTGMLKGEIGTLTGNHEIQNVCGEERVMLEVSHDFGTDMIFEEYISQ